MNYPTEISLRQSSTKHPEVLEAFKPPSADDVVHLEGGFPRFESVGQGLSDHAYHTASPLSGFPDRAGSPGIWVPEILILGADRRRGIISGVIVRRRRRRAAGALVSSGEKPFVIIPDGDPEEVEAILEAAHQVAVDAGGMVEAVEAAEAVEAVGGATGAKRGQIGPYTPAVRKRFREAVLAIGHLLVPRCQGMRNGKSVFFHPASFLTLTYHEGRVPSAAICARHLGTFIKAFRRRFPAAFALRVREFQRNGSLHHQWVVCWGETVWTEPWRVRHEWVRETWADIVEADMGPDPAHRKACTQLSAVISAKALADYVAKGGVQKLQPGAAVAADLTKRAQKMPPPDHLEGHKWWAFVNRKAYDRAARRFRVRVAPPVALAIESAMWESWQALFGRKEIEVDPWRVPRWASGRYSDEILAAASARQAVLSAEWEDVKTGEVDDGRGFDVSAQRLAVSIASGEVTLEGAAEQIAAQVRPPPSVSVRVVPALWMPAGSPPLSRGGLSLVRPPGAGPPRSLPGPVHCANCGREQSRLGPKGLCIICQPGFLPPGGGRKANTPGRGAEPRREEGPRSLFG